MGIADILFRNGDADWQELKGMLREGSGGGQQPVREPVVDELAAAKRAAEIAKYEAQAHAYRQQAAGQSYSQADVDEAVRKALRQAKSEYTAIEDEMLARERARAEKEAHEHSREIIESLRQQLQVAWDAAKAAKELYIEVTQDESLEMAGALSPFQRHRRLVAAQLRSWRDTDGQIIDATYRAQYGRFHEAAQAALRALGRTRGRALRDHDLPGVETQGFTWFADEDMSVVVGKVSQRDAAAMGVDLSGLAPCQHAGTQCRRVWVAVPARVWFERYRDLPSWTGPLKQALPFSGGTDWEADLLEMDVAVDNMRLPEDIQSKIDWFDHYEAKRAETLEDAEREAAMAQDRADASLEEYVDVDLEFRRASFMRGGR